MHSLHTFFKSHSCNDWRRGPTMGSSVLGVLRQPHIVCPIVSSHDPVPLLKPFFYLEDFHLLMQHTFHPVVDVIH